MSIPRYAAGDDTRLPPARASACERLAKGLGFVHACPRCEAERLPGSVCGFFTAEGLRRHRFEVHGEAQP